MINCPICNKEVKNLLAHIKVHSNNFSTRKDIEKQFPELKGKQLQFEPKKETATCPVCNKIFKNASGMKNHVKAFHNDYYNDNYKKKYNSIKEQTCPICNKLVYDLKQHVFIYHKLNWLEFCETYNHDKKLSKIVLDNYKKTLSKNKKEFYNSERGIQRRYEQSKEMKINNPMFDIKTKQKQIFALSNIEKKTISHSNIGIRSFYKNKKFRSFAELSVYLWAEINGIELEYENAKAIFYWTDPDTNLIRNYIPDFFYKNTFIEIKSTDRELNEAKLENKYILSLDVIKKAGYNFELHTPNSFMKKFEISKIDNIILFDNLRKIYNNDEIQFYCRKNSRIVKKIVCSDSLENIKGVFIYNGKH